MITQRVRRFGNLWLPSSVIIQYKGHCINTLFITAVEKLSFAQFHLDKMLRDCMVWGIACRVRASWPLFSPGFAQAMELAKWDLKDLQSVSASPPLSRNCTSTDPPTPAILSCLTQFATAVVETTLLHTATSKLSSAGLQQGRTDIQDVLEQIERQPKRENLGLVNL